MTSVRDGLARSETCGTMGSQSYSERWAGHKSVLRRSVGGFSRRLPTRGDLDLRAGATRIFPGARIFSKLWRSGYFPNLASPTWSALSATSYARHADYKPLMQVPPPHRPLSRQFRQCDGDRRGLSVTQFGLRSLLTVLKPASKPLSRSKKDPPD